MTKENRKQHRHHHQKRSNRSASAQKVTSSPKKSKTAHSPSPVSNKADNMEISPPPPAEAEKAGHSKKSSRCSTATKPVNAGQHSRPISSTSFHSSNKPQAKGNYNSSTTTTAEHSRACSSNGEVMSGTETIIVSRCSKCRSVISSNSHAREQSRSASGRSSGRASSKSVTSVQSVSTKVLSTSVSERGRSLEKRAELKAEAVRKDLHQ